MTTITPITGNITTTDNRSASDVVYLVSAVYATANSTALNITAGTNVEVVFRTSGSVFNTFGFGAAVSSNVDIRLTVEEGSTLSSGFRAINVQGHALTLRNFGSIISASTAIALGGNGSSIENYGEIGGSVAYSGISSSGSTINNFGTFRSNNPSGNALDLGDLNDTINNYGTVFGTTDLYSGTDAVFNSGTMRGAVAILVFGSTGNSTGNKTILNSGLIATTSTYAIRLGDGNDTVTNLGHILGEVELGHGSNTFISGQIGSVTGTVIGGSDNDSMSGGANADRFFGAGGFDLLLGGGGDDYLDGGAGDDYMRGGTGSDYYAVDSNLDGIKEIAGQGIDTVDAFASYTLQAGVEVENLNSAATNGVTLTGNEFAQAVRGSTGDDTLAGGAGSDSLDGGLGNDLYVLGAEATGVDTVTDSGGYDAISSTITRSLTSYAQVEYLLLLGTAAIDGTGNALVNGIFGNAAANVLDGGAGADSMRGSTGNDTYVVDNAGDVVDETSVGFSGVDTVRSSVTFSLADIAHVFGPVENLALAGPAAIGGTGNDLANVITGNAAANALGGGGGNDTLVGANGIDTLSGGAGNDTLDGGLGNDSLLGLAGNDVLIGNLGKDTSTGGAGNDIFRFATKTHSAAGASADIITDFDDANDDRIDVSALFGPALTYRHNLAFAAAGQLRINDIAGADLLVEVNTGGSLAADFAIRLTNTSLASMSAADFFL